MSVEKHDHPEKVSGCMLNFALFILLLAIIAIASQTKAWINDLQRRVGVLEQKK